MKRVVSLIVILFTFLLIIPFVIAEDNITIDDSEDEQSKVDDAYDCLDARVDGNCDSISPEERIFSLLAINKCRSSVIDDASNEECWPDSGCRIKTTAQAILALNRVGSSTTKAENWLVSHNTTPSDVAWFLQIDSSSQTTCTITYDDNSYSIIVGEDKKINSDAGTCLDRSSSGYWLRISSTCQEKEFEISCDKSFLTSLLFQKIGSSTFHVSEDTNSASAEGTTVEKVNSFCFTAGNTCDYEGSLWAALVLNHLDYDITPYIPYLVTMADENPQYLPESFLYLLTGYSNFRSDLLVSQEDNYWQVSDEEDKFYDTALALQAIQYEETPEKTAAIDWLLEVQDNDGCWKGNIRNTAFILYAVWPKTLSTVVDVGDEDCTDSGYFCMSQISCEGEILEDYSCGGVSKCCDTPKSGEECRDQGGEICNSDENCLGGTMVDASDTSYGETCCIEGICDSSSPQLSECEEYYGECKSFCDDDEQESGDECTYSSDLCCVSKTPEDTKSYWWVWILLILIVLVLLGIIFRDKLRPFWFRLKSMFKKGGKPGTTPPRTSPGFPRPPLMRRPGQRKIFLPSRKTPARKPVGKRPSGEIEDVLKKLRAMGK